MKLYRYLVLVGLLVVNTFCYSQEKTYQSILESLQKSIPEISTEKATFSQEIYENSSKTVVFKAATTDAKGKTKESEYSFNFSDIDLNSVRPITKGDVIKVQLIVHGNQKLIKVNQENKKIFYVSKIDFLAKDINNARILAGHVKEIIPLSKIISEKSLGLKGYKDRLDYLASNITNVSLIKKEYQQVFSTTPELVGNVKLEVTKSSGSKTNTEVYYFNIATLNANNVGFKVTGGEIVITIGTRRKLKTVKVENEGVQKNYENSVKIIASSIENAKNIVKVFKDLIPLGEQEFKKNIPTVASVEEGLGFINTLIEKIDYNDESVIQKLDPDCVTSFEKKQESIKKSVSKTYTFSFLDLVSQNVDFKISGKEIKVVLDLGKKYVQLKEEEALKNFVDNVEIETNSVGHAIIISEVVKQIIDKCKASKEKIVIKNKLDGLEMFTKQIQSISIDDIQYDQELTSSKNSVGGQLLKLVQLVTTAKKSKENIYEFNLIDINHRTVDIKISGNKVYLEFSTKYMEKIIKTYENGVAKNYTNSLTFICTSVENARKMKEILIELTKEN